MFDSGKMSLFFSLSLGLYSLSGATPLPAPKATIDKRTFRGVDLVNCHNADQISSGIAWYGQRVPNGQQPDDYKDVDHGSYASWESPGSGSKHEFEHLLSMLTLMLVTFDSGVTVSWTLDPNVLHRDLSDNEYAGTATNGYEDFTLYKSPDGVLYTTNNGWICSAVYYGS